MAYEAVESGQKVIIEGAQGTMLDLDHGTYPFVTSSHPASAGSLLGAGIGPVNGIEIIGICKAYTSRVGEGPFPTECRDETGEFLREKGHEYGATTGRPRRCGWLDGVVLKYAVRVNSITSLVITKLDILGGLPHIQLCTGYQVGNEKTSVVPLSSEAWNQCQPVYDELDGWEEDISEIHSYGELPAATRRYLEFIEDFTSIPVGIISVGPDRNQTIIRKEYF
ncbi:MAG: adenylosuccinate synthetase [Atribacterota bacterium]